MVDSAAFNGDYEKNPYNFKTTSFLGISVNGEEVPFKPLQLSYAAANPRYIEAYLAMFSGTGKFFTIVETTFRAMISRTAMACTLPS